MLMKMCLLCWDCRCLLHMGCTMIDRCHCMCLLHRKGMLMKMGLLWMDCMCLLDSLCTGTKYRSSRLRTFQERIDNTELDL